MKGSAVRVRASAFANRPHMRRSMGVARAKRCRRRSMTSRGPRSLSGMNPSRLHIGRVATIVVPVTSQSAALAFYVDVLGMRKVNDFTYPSGERWLEVSPAEGSANLCLVVGGPARPAGVETGVV